MITVLPPYDYAWREGVTPRTADPDGTKDNWWWYQYRKEQASWSANFWRVLKLLEARNDGWN
jgi:hypothetical protein